MDYNSGLVPTTKPCGNMMPLNQTFINSAIATGIIIIAGAIGYRIIKANGIVINYKAITINIK